jgi:hypothetical protein
MGRSSLRDWRIVASAAACCMLVACAAPPPPGTYPGSPTPPVTKTVSNPIAGIAQMAVADVNAGVAELVAAGANNPNAPLPLQDSYACGLWLQVAIPQAVAITNGLIPTAGAIQGPYSLFIAGKIAYVNVKGTIGSVQSNFIDTFNHNCGSAVAGDVNAINMLLLKVGIQVGGLAIPGIGVLGNLIPALP